MKQTAETWIWCAGEPRPHWAVNFRRTFEIPAGGCGLLRIAAENDFVLHLDGAEILRGQYRDFPKNKTFTTLEIPLAAGRHALAVSGYYTGADFQTVIDSGAPGLFLTLRLPNGRILAADRSWKVRTDPAHLRDRIDKVNPQLGFCFGFDARRADGWTVLDYDDSAWDHAVEFSRETGLHERPTPPLAPQPLLPGRLIRSGTLFRGDAGADKPYAVQVQADSYDDGRRADGRYFVFDFGREEFGLLELAVEADPGTVCDISHAEHLTGGKVQALVGARCFTDRYITGGAGEGERYVLSRRVGCRFVQINCVYGRVYGIRAAVRPLRFPLPPPRMPECDDPETRLILDASRRTLELCMHEHYVDCPWREQALYGGDTRFQILFGYDTWGNYDYAAANLELIGESLLPGNWLPAICAPSRMTPQIPLFGMMWIVAVYEHFLNSSTKRVFETQKERIARLTETLLAGYDPESGLYDSPSGPTVWNFYEWRPGLNGLDDAADVTDFSRLDRPPVLEAPFNLYLIETFRALAGLTGEPEYADRARRLGDAVWNRFYDGRRNALLTGTGAPATHELVQALALYNRIVPAESIGPMLDGIVRGDHIPISLASMFYVVEALSAAGGRYAEWLDHRMQTTFLPMARGVSGTMWETELGAADFEGAGSLCHGWSALPLYYHHRRQPVAGRAPGLALEQV